MTEEKPNVDERHIVLNSDKFSYRGATVICSERTVVM